MIKRVIVLAMLSCSVYVCGMDMKSVWAVDPQVAKRHNVQEWNNQLLVAVIYKQENKLSELLQKAGNDAQELVSSHWSTYGTILEAAYFEKSSESNIIKQILDHMRIESLMICFNRKKQDLYSIWAYNDARGANLQSRPCAENIVRDLHLKDPNRFPLTPQECEKLGIKQSILN